MRVRVFIIAILLTIFVIILYKLHSSSTNTDLDPGDLGPDGAVYHHRQITSAGGTKLSVRVFYEVLCPDSKYFIVRQLHPAWVKLSAINLTHLVEVQLVPYGKASSRMREGKYKFECQHGEEECRLNRIHSCLLANPTLEFGKKLDMIKCSISSPAYTAECGLTDCPNGDQLLYANGLITSQDLGSISFVPTITVNKSQKNQIDLLKNFYSEIIRELNSS